MPTSLFHLPPFRPPGNSSIFLPSDVAATGGAGSTLVPGLGSFGWVLGPGEGGGSAMGRLLLGRPRLRACSWGSSSVSAGARCIEPRGGVYQRMSGRMEKPTWASRRQCLEGFLLGREARLYTPWLCNWLVLTWLL